MCFPFIWVSFLRCSFTDNQGVHNAEGLGSFLEVIYFISLTKEQPYIFCSSSSRLCRAETQHVTHRHSLYKLTDLWDKGGKQRTGGCYSTALLNSEMNAWQNSTRDKYNRQMRADFSWTVNGLRTVQENRHSFYPVSNRFYFLLCVKDYNCRVISGKIDELLWTEETEDTQNFPLNK